MKKGLLHHIELYVSSLEKTKRFWGWLLIELGYEVYQDWEKGISWRLDNTYLVFVQVDEKFNNIPYHRCRVGLNHLAFHVESKQHVNELTKLLKENGTHILYENKHPFAGGPDHYAVYFEDPDRIKVELVAP
ncbi:VOC family protein [Cytobacillus sp. S13-E01]|uniref:VOC family protein n=1 Tax=Cytobacillus sp. S13-E01 TaxID=3031326 RepID=UPI0023D7FF7B|nr:VOC family protein [Cytobacillus sp. S13-E01]MDF0725396.1 VOC family protein [Cytobacillus sp. S13-E01]